MARKTFLAFGCVHRPLHDESGIAWLLSEIRERQPHYLINLGDTIDAACLSDFEKDGDEANLEDEYESTGELLQSLKDAHRKAKRVWMEGNHEQRIRRSRWKKLASLIDYRRQIPQAKDWEHRPYKYAPESVFTLGQASFYHGFAVGRGAVKGESVKLGVPYGLTVSAHTHRPHPVHRISMGVTPLPWWMVNTGCFIGEADYMETKDDSLWGQGLVSGTVDVDVRHDGRQRWEAELVLRRMFWDVGGAA